MKRFISCILAAVMMISYAPGALGTDEPEALASEAVCLMDAKTGQVLFDKNMHEVMYPASITKIMTAGLALEKGIEPSSTVEMNDDAVWSVGRDTTHIALTPGEVVNVNDILYGTMLQSANDCANGLALFVDGDLEKFAQRMTDKAAEVGALNTHFVNANGLPDPEHVTTAYDMAMITKWAITVPGFREVFGADTHTMPPTNKQPKERNFYQGHKSLNHYSDFYYEYATGGKTGWTEEARNTSVTLAEKDGIELIAVTLHAQEAEGRYTDVEKLFDYGFKNFNHADFSKERFSQAPVPVYDGDNKVGEVIITPKDVTITKPSTAAKADIKIQIDLPIRYNLGDEIAPSVKFILKDKVLADVPFSFTENIEEAHRAPVTAVPDEEIKDTSDGGFHIPAWLCFVFAFIFFIIALLFGIRSVNIVRYNRRMARKAEIRRRRAAGPNTVHPAQDHRRPQEARRRPPQRRTPTQRHR